MAGRNYISTRDTLIQQAEALGFSRDNLRSLTTKNIQEAVRVARDDREELGAFIQKFQEGRLETVRATIGRVEPKSKSIVTPATAPRQVPTPFWTKPQLPGKGEGGVSILHPFQVTLENVSETETPDWKATVYTGNLYNGLGNWGNTAIVGLGAPFTVVEDDYIYLTGTYVSNALDEVNVDSGSTLPGRTVIDTGPPAEQTSWTTRIARVVSNGGTGLVVEQALFSHLTLEQKCVAGVSIEYPTPIS